MNRNTFILIAVIFALAGVGIALVLPKNGDPPDKPDREPKPNGKKPPEPPKEFEGLVKDVDITRVFPPEKDRGGLDPATKAFLHVVGGVLPDVAGHPWPARFACPSDETKGDVRTVMVRLEKTLHVRGRAVGGEFLVTVRSETDDAPHSFSQLTAGKTPLTTPEGLRAAFETVEAFKRLGTPALHPETGKPDPKATPRPLWEQIGFGLEADDIAAVRTSPADDNEDGRGVRVTVVSFPFELTLRRAGEVWVASRIVYHKRANP